MSRLFISHSSTNNAEAVAICDWLAREGWNEVFLDLDAERGIKAGERWERALNEAASRCEAVLFLISRPWLASRWCLKEFNLARRLNKRLFGVVIEPMPLSEVPDDLNGAWQVVDLAAGQDHLMMRVTLPRTHEEAHVTFSREGLSRLRSGLAKAGLEPRFFAWPPEDDPERPPYRGLKPLEAEDAGIFFGRDAPVLEALDRLRGLREAAAPRLLILLGASGAGKSSFLRAGLLPRLARDDRNFLTLPIIRPERAALTGDTGLIAAIDSGLAAHGLAQPRATIRSAVAQGADGVRPLLQKLAEAAFAQTLAEEGAAPLPAVVLAIDQAEELFEADGIDEGEAFLALLRDLAVEDQPAILALFAIRSDSYDRLETAKALEGLRQETFPLLPMPRGAYQTVIEGPPARLADTDRRLEVEPRLTQRLLEDTDRNGGSDALPLLAFTLEQLYLDYGVRTRAMKLADYEAFGGIAGAIEAAVERALREANKDPRIPRERDARLALLRRGLIPWLAGIDPETGSARRRIARRSDLPAESEPLIRLLVEQRLLATDRNATTSEITIEPAHEALLRQWSQLQGWLKEDSGLLSVMDGVKRARQDWTANRRMPGWLTHVSGRLEAAERLRERPDLAADLDAEDHEYLAACRKADTKSKRRKQQIAAVVYVLLLGIITGLIGWINQAYIKEQVNWFVTMRPYMMNRVRPYVLSSDSERALASQSSFRECDADCPEMIVIPAGSFTMGSPLTEGHRYDDESPQHTVTIAHPIAISKFDVTFAEWDACVAVGGCPPVSDSGFGRNMRPVINITWEEAQKYTVWLAQMTGRQYRLLTEAEWEYAARAGTSTAYYWGDDVGVGNANCSGCGSQWDNKETAPVGSFKPNAFGLYDMAGNVWQWTQDCYHNTYEAAPDDGSAWTTGDCSRRIRRGAGWGYSTWLVRSANRGADSPVNRSAFVGFRIARTLMP